MKDVAVVFLTVLVPLSFAISAGALAYHGRDGWGWFLFVAFLIASSMHIKVD